MTPEDPEPLLIDEEDEETAAYVRERTERLISTEGTPLLVAASFNSAI